MINIKRLILPLLLLFAFHANAQTETNSDWLDREYGYFAQSESLRSLFYDFASSISIPVVVSSRVNHNVSGNFPSVRAEEFLSNMTKVYQLTWVFDGTTLYVYDMTEIKSETIEIPFALSDKFQSYFHELKIKGTPLDWRFIPTQNIVQLSGPPRFIELMRNLVKRVTSSKNGGEGGSHARGTSNSRGTQNTAGLADNNDYVVRVFYIKYAYVDAAINTASEGDQPTANLAAMIGKIMNVAHISRIEQSTGGRQRGGKLLGEGLVPSAKAQNENTQAKPPSGPREQEAYIIGDPRINAIVVRDLSSRMPVYANLIQELDKPLDQIEIEVMVMDISGDETENLGLNIFDTENVSLNLNNALSFQYATRTALDRASFSGLLFKINALNVKGKGRILSRPSVLTLDNHQAQFQNNQTFYVRLGVPEGTAQGAAVDLVPVTYGSNLKVRPHVIYENDHRKIQLAIHVEDGRRSAGATAVTGVPEIAQNIIQTQAVIREGQTLLVGGHIIRTVTSDRSRIPILGYIPIIGLAFSNTKDVNRSVARYFAITPKIINSSLNYQIKTGIKDIDAYLDKEVPEGETLLMRYPQIKKKNSLPDRRDRPGPP